MTEGVKYTLFIIITVILIAIGVLIAAQFPPKMTFTTFTWSMGVTIPVVVGIIYAFVKWAQKNDEAKWKQQEDKMKFEIEKVRNMIEEHKEVNKLQDHATEEYLQNIEARVEISLTAIEARFDKALDKIEERVKSLTSDIIKSNFTKPITKTTPKSN